MQVPIYIDDRPVGTLTLERRGPWTELDARLPDVGRVVRLTLYGEVEFYCGVPVPEGGGLRLLRRLTAAEARTLPRTPRYAAEGPRSEKAASAPEEDRPRHVLWHGGRPHYF